MQEDVREKLLVSVKYDILPKISTPLQSVQDARPETFSVGKDKLSDTFYLNQPDHVNQMVSLNSKRHSQIMSSEVISKIPLFTGDQPPQKEYVKYMSTE